MIDLFTIVIAMEFLVIAIAMFAFRENIAKAMYGVRYKKWLELDTGRSGYVILDKSMDTCKIMGQRKAVKRENILNGWIYFVNENAENMKLENAPDKWQYYCNSEEFDTVYKNKLLQTLMLVMEANIVKIIMLLMIVCIIAVGYCAYQIMLMDEKITFLVAQVQAYVPGQQ